MSIDPIARGLAARANAKLANWPAISALERLRAGYKAARKNNPSVNVEMASPPTLTTSASAPGGDFTSLWQWIRTSVPGVLNSRTVVTAYGGVPQVSLASNTGVSASAATLPSGGNVSATRRNSVWRLGWKTDSDVVVFNIGSSSANLYRIIVDGQYISKAGHIFNAAPGGTWVTLTFAAKSTDAREIYIEIPSGSYFFQIASRSTDSVFPIPDNSGMRIVVGGDSYVAGTDTSPLGWGFARVLGDCFGAADTWMSGSGGTGFVATASGAGYKMIDRLVPDFAAPAPDLLIIASGTNDATVDFLPQVPAAVSAFYQACRAQPALARIPIIHLGVWGTGIATQVKLDTETAVSTAISSLNDPLLSFVPFLNTGRGLLANPNNDPWLYGSGRAGTPTGNGNNDVYLSADGAHPNNAGHFFIGTRGADAIMACAETMIWRLAA